MLPIGDTHRKHSVPVANWLLIAINALVFLYEIQLPYRALDRFILNWGVIPHNVLLAVAHPTAPYALHAFETLITSQFIHGGWLHILGNMLFLWIFGDDIEDRLGSVLYVMFYLVCGVIAGLVQVFVLSNMFSAQDMPNIGASGAIAGVLGAYLVLYPTTRITALIPLGIIPIPVALPAFLLIGWWFIQQFLYGIMSLSPVAAQGGGIAFWAHVGGFLAGMLLILPFVIEDHERVQQF